MAARWTPDEHFDEDFDDESIMYRRPRFVLFGDSITQQGFSTVHCGWVAQLSDKYQRKVDVVNRGYSGYNTKWAKELMPQVSNELRTKHEIERGSARDVVAIFFGANDAALAGSTGHEQHVPLHEYKENLGVIVDYFRSHKPNPPHVVLVTPPPMDANAWAAFCIEKESNRTLEGVRRYAETCAQVAREKGVPLVNAWEGMHERLGKDELASLFWDGLHLSSKGNKLLYEAFLKVVENDLPGYRADDLAWDRPQWRNIDYRDYKRSFRKVFQSTL
ncbi:putative esterase [Chloropicon primus]|uniref:Putative esterase n=2 Tax=Chloropicon primus TaxID=1764295 RepID=A0A5B8MTP0_9CHLO|nr:putative esterase [Chloropicon primus]UPR02920.1 putative esterase [Chloropicon primus]|eukprot:QDZ23707.1 putative esterase [Chloropicon primus]